MKSQVDNDSTEGDASRITLLLREAQSRIWQHMQHERGHGKGFVASDFALVNKALERIAREQISRGPLFCEWGSGFGVVAMLAFLHGFESYGIEIQHDLVLAAVELAEGMGCDVRFAHGSFASAHDADLLGSTDHTWWQTSECSAYQDLDVDPADFDLFFVYPWPGEEQVFDRLFMRYASVGALLLTYHDGDGVLVQRKTAIADIPEVVGWY